MGSIYLGRNVLIKVSTNGQGGSQGSWQTIGQQTGGSWARNTDTVDITTKDASGWAQNIVSRKNWTVTCEGRLDPSDTAYGYLVTNYGNKVHIRIDASAAVSGEIYEGQAYVSSITQDFPTDDSWNYTVEFTGDGEISKVST